MKKDNDLNLAEIRQKQAEEALEVARKIDPITHIGIKNDATYYLSINKEADAAKVKEALEEAGIKTIQIYHALSDRYALYLQDEQVEEPEDEDAAS